MESIFNLEKTQRSSLFQQILESFGFTYVCLWSHVPHPSNCLTFIDGVYKEEASSSSGRSLAMRSFLNYQKSIFFVENINGGVPGFAFVHNLNYMERRGVELLNFATNSAQLQFYQEARIKTAIFMGCKNGEIELGMPNGSSHINFEIELKKLFPGDFHQEVPLNPARASSSSSSLRSLSMDNSAEYSPFLYNMLQTTSSYNMPEIFGLKEAFVEQQASNQTPSSSTMRSEDPLQQALNEIRTTQLIPSREDEEAAMTRAILAAIASSSSSSSFASAFQRYRSFLGPTKQRVLHTRQNLNRRSLSFFRNLSEARAQSQMIQTTRPATNQLHHMVSERKRREKINESFQALRSLLPPGTKKDKAAVLSNTKEYITSLKSEIEVLNKRNKILEAEQSGNQVRNQYSDERLNVRIANVGESTSESRIVDLEVNVRGNSELSDLVVRVLGFLKQVENATVMSLDADTRMSETEAFVNRLVLRLRIQGSEWDESSFQEAVRRVLDDLAQ